MPTTKMMRLARRICFGVSSRGGEHDDDAGQEHRRLTAHEIERLEIELGGDRRARGERQNEAGAHQQQQAEEHQAVDGEPPVRQHALFGAGDPHAALPCVGCTGTYARKAHDMIAEAFAARLEIGELVVGGAGRRQQHHGLGPARAPRIGGGGLDGAVERPALHVVDVSAELRGEIISGFADEIGAGDPGKERLESCKAAGFRAAADDPINVGEARERLGGGVGVGRLRVVDEQHRAQPSPPAPCGGRGRQRCRAPWRWSKHRGLASARARKPPQRSANYGRRARIRCRRGLHAHAQRPFQPRSACRPSPTRRFPRDGRRRCASPHKVR